MRKTYTENVSLASTFKPALGGRCGTAHISLKEFASHFGEPHAKDVGGKVKAIWSIDTPRGPANVRDYWWNGERELTVSAGNAKAARWAIGWLRTHGIKACRCTAAYRCEH